MTGKLCGDIRTLTDKSRYLSLVLRRTAAKTLRTSQICFIRNIKMKMINRIFMVNIESLNYGIWAGQKQMVRWRKFVSTLDFNLQ